MKCPEENIAKILQGIYIGKGFQKRTQITPKINSKKKQIELHRIRKLTCSKEIKYLLYTQSAKWWKKSLLLIHLMGGLMSNI